MGFFKILDGFFSFYKSIRKVSSTGFFDLLKGTSYFPLHGKIGQFSQNIFPSTIKFPSL